MKEENCWEKLVTMCIRARIRLATRLIEKYPPYASIYGAHFAREELSLEKPNHIKSDQMHFDFS